RTCRAVAHARRRARAAARARRARRRARAGREREPPEQRVEQRRLAAAVRAHERQPLPPGHRHIERSEAKRTALDDGVLQSHDDVAAPYRGREPEAELPGLVWLVDAFEVRD